MSPHCRCNSVNVTHAKSACSDEQESFFCRGNEEGRENEEKNEQTKARKDERLNQNEKG